MVRHQFHRRCQHHLRNSSHRLHHLHAAWHSRPFRDAARASLAGEHRADRLMGAMRIALCNEVIAALPFEQQCEFAAALGYDGLEVAPFTLGEDPHRIGAQQRTSIRNAARNAGVTITGLHWLLIKPAGLSITTDDKEVRRQTLDVMRRLIGLCADLDGRVLVHGSPVQRRLPEGPDAAAARRRGEGAFAEIAEDAARAGVVYCIEPLSRHETNFINHVAEAAALIERWLPTGLVAHIQVNDRNRRGPGQGEDRFAPVFATLKHLRYAGVVAVEPFEYVPDGTSAAAHAIGYIRGILEALPQWH